MAKFKIISDSSCDLTPELAKQHDIDMVRFYITFDGTTYLKESVDITIEEYFRKLTTENVFPKTSQPSPQDYIDAYTPALKEGKDILVFCISSPLSGSTQSAVNAANLMKEEYPDRKIRVIDSKQAFVSMALMIFECIKLRDKDYDVDFVADYAEKLAKETKMHFMVDTLEYLQKGGRIGKASALIGGMLNLKPILTLVDGSVVPVAKARGRKKGVANMIEILQSVIKGKEDEYEYIVGHIIVPEDAEVFKAEIEKACGIKVTYPLLSAGAVLGTHVGPGAMAIVYTPKFKG